MLALAWAILIAFGIIMYVLLDGFDLGIGILSITVREKELRELMVSTILPVWDGNQTWLVFGGAALYGAFPLAFSTILPAMYIPLLIMVVALLFRGIVFEFRLKAIKTKLFWEICFFLGSLFAVIAQGLILGTFVAGFTLPEKGGLHQAQWLNPFGIACAIGLICGYSLLGANYLIMKTSGELQERAFKTSNIMQYFILAAFIMVSLWSPLLDPAIMQRWFNPAHMPFLAILPTLALLCFAIHWHALKKRDEYKPFWATIGMFLTCYFGFIISIYPYLVPRKITYLEAAAPASSLLFMFIGACIMLPTLLYYTYHAYKIFNGKVTEKLGY